MGSIVASPLKLDGKRYGGKALLESDYMEFKGDTRLKIPFRSISRAAEDEALRISFDRKV